VFANIKRIRRFKSARFQSTKREVETSRSQTDDFVSVIKRTIDYVYFMRQGSGTVLLFEIEVANLAFRPRLETRSLDSHDLGVNANKRQIPQSLAAWRELPGTIVIPSQSRQK
jgi:hypothetical protein